VKPASAHVPVWSLALPRPALSIRGVCGRCRSFGSVRPATTIVLGILLVMIFGAAMLQFLVLAR